MDSNRHALVFPFRRFSRFAGLAVAAWFTLCGATARADAFSTYAVSSTFSLPSGSSTFDALPDGRIVAVSETATVYLETSAGSHTLVPAGPPLSGASIPSFGPAFVRASPDGSKIAVGNNGGPSFDNFQVGVFTIATLAGTWFAANHFDGRWIDNRYVALTAGSFSGPASVTALDTTSANPASPVNITIVSDIGGASGGIAFDAAGNLYTANGFQTSGPSGTGAVYAIRSAAWHAALAGGSPVDFETQGTPIVDLLSGSPLAFAPSGDLFVGGGNSFGSPPDDNYFAIVRASAVAAALAGGGMINGNNTSSVRKLDPDPASGSEYTVIANVARGEVYAVPFGSATVSDVRPALASTPALPSWAVAVLAIALGAMGTRLRSGAGRERWATS
jgi:hypothetical protein